MVFKQKTLFLVFLIIGIALFFNARNNPFHYDDHHSIQYNPHIRVLGNISTFFTDPHTFSSQQSGYMFRPLLLSSFALNYAWGGQQVGGYRWVNLLLHVACAFLVYRLVLILTGRETCASTAGLVFLIHPTHGELINYISSRSDLLVSFFYLSACLCSAPGTPTTTRIWSQLLYIGGLLAKSVAITFPVMAAFGQSCWGGWQRTMESWRFYLGLTVASSAYLGIIWANRFIESSVAKTPRSLDVQIWTQIKALVYYLWILCVPVKLNVEHQFCVSQWLWQPATVCAGFFIISLAILVMRSRQKIITFGSVWFVVTLLPASLVPLNILVSERRIYLASAGLILVFGWIWGQFSNRKRREAIWIGVAICLIFSALGFQRNRVWAEDVSLWEDAVQKAPLMYRARLNLAIAYDRAGWRDKALVELKRGLELKPDYADAWVVMANIHKDRGEIAKAEEGYRKALSFNPHLPGVYHNLGNLYFTEKENPSRAIQYFEECLRLDENFVKARNNLGQAYEAVGRQEDGMFQYERAIADSLFWESLHDPELGGTWYNLARANQRLERFERAAQAYRKAHDLLRQHPPPFEAFARQALEELRKLEGRSR
jgi:protein O-mannosyl-transferase